MCYYIYVPKIKVVQKGYKIMYFRKKWKPSKSQIEEFKEKLEIQDNWLDNFTKDEEVISAKWNDNKSSLYVSFKDGSNYRISTHHLPSYEDDTQYRSYKGNPAAGKWIEIVTNSRNNIMNKADNLLLQKKYDK